MAAAGRKAWSIERLIESSRKSSAALNHSASLALFTASSYSLAKKQKSGAIYVLDVATGAETKIIDGKDAREPVFISDRQFLYLSNQDDKSTLMKYDLDQNKATKLQQFDSLIENLTFHKKGILGFSAKVNADGEMLSPEEMKRLDEQDALVYDNLFVRHWDSWKTAAKNAIFTTKPDLNASEFKLSKPTNIIGSHNLECPISPFGDSSDFSISATHVAFVSKDPDVNEAWNTAAQVWLRPHGGSGEPERINRTRGASSCPVFSPEGDRLAFLEMRIPGYEADRRRVVLYSLESKTTTDLCPDWDRSPSSITWSEDGNNLFLIAEDHGRSKLFTLALDGTSTNSEPTAAAFEAQHGSLSSISIAEDGSMLMSSSSMARQMSYSLIRPDGQQHVLSSGEAEGLSDRFTSEFWFESNGRLVHGWIVKPDNFDERKTYPMIFLIHGGPQGAWTDSWSTRWHPNTMANYGDGYVCVAINPTGSTSYGQKFCDDIQGAWGSLPYEDLANGLEYVLKTFKYIDPERLVAAGASYGGYMINWIQGHELGRKFKALVCHDGVFNTLNVFYTTEELYFPERDFLGPPWDPTCKAIYEAWNPSNFISNWATPQMIIHSSKDYRLPETEGLAAFNVLQRLGIESKLLVFKSENHWVLKPENSKIWHEEVMKWIEAHTSDSQGHTRD